jgi:ribonuclease HI/exonuclease III
MVTETNILHWNIQGLRSKRLALHDYISKYEPAVICLQETLSKEDTPAVHANYKFIHRKSNGGYERGVLTAVRRDIYYKPNDYVDIGIPPHHICDVTITLQNCKLRVVNIYRSSSNNNDLNFSNLSGLKNVIVCGDYNAKHPVWGINNKSCPVGRHIVDHLNDINSFTILNTGNPTHQSGSSIDMTLCSNDFATQCRWMVETSLFSDHFAGKIVIDDAIPNVLIPCRLSWRMRKPDWVKVNEHIDQAIYSSPPLDDLEAEEESLTNIVINSLDQCYKRTTPKPIKLYKQTWQENEEYIKAKNRVNRFTRLFRKFGNKYKVSLRQAQKDARAAAFAAKEQTFKKWCSELDAHSNLTHMWNHIRRLQNKCSPFQLDPEPEQTSNKLINQFVGRSRTDQLPSNVQKRLNELKSQRQQDLDAHINMPDDTDVHFTIGEFVRALNVKRKSAPGSDGITYEIIRNLSPSFHSRLLALYNRSWTLGRLPVRWKTAVITPIPKPADPDNPRPISLLSVVDKVMERMVLPRLTWKLGPLHDHVRAYLQGRSTNDCLMQLFISVSDQDKKRSTHKPIAIFLDLEKAFELSNKLAITDKLIERGVKGRMLAWLADYLTDRSACVRFQGVSSENLKFENGTPQGAIVSPLLFNLLMEDVVSQKYTKNTSIYSYADDLLLINKKAEKEHLLEDLRRLEGTCDELGLKISARKTKAMRFRTNLPSPFQIQIQGSNIEWVNEFRYLGVIVDRKLTFNSHVKNVKHRANQRLNVMRCISGQKGGASHVVLTLYYKMAIRSIIEYSNCVWIMISKTSSDALDTIQSAALRIITGACRTAKITVLEHATGMIPLIGRRHTSMLKMLDKVLRDEDHPSHVQVHNHLQDFSTCYNGRSWLNAAKQHWDHAQTTAQLEIPQPEAPLVRCPWQSTKAEFHAQLPDIKKADMALEILRTTALQSMSKYEHPSIICAFTDGSVDPDSNRAGCGVHIRHLGSITEKCARLQNGFSTLQAELHAIDMALEMAAHISKTAHLVIFTDSLSSIHTLRKISVNQNTHLISSIFCRLDARIGPATSFEWIPSHTGIAGNERADTLAKNSLSNNEIAIPGTYICRSQQIARIIDHEKRSTVEQNCINIVESPSFSEYSEWTDLKHFKITAKHRPDQVIMFYFFTGYKTPRELGLPGTDPICPDCKADNYDLYHFLYECTEHTTATNQLLTSLNISTVDHKAVVQLSMLQSEPILNFFREHPPPIYLGPRKITE